MHIQFKLLGYAGLIPFVAIPFAIYLNALSYTQGFHHFVQYSAIILSFFGGVHWFNAVSENKVNHQLYVAMLPSIVAWIALVFLDSNTLLMALSVSYIGILMYDKFTLRLAKDIVIEYTKLRIVLTTTVVISHLAMAVI